MAVWPYRLGDCDAQLGHVAVVDWGSLAPIEAKWMDKSLKHPLLGFPIPRKASESVAIRRGLAHALCQGRTAKSGQSGKVAPEVPGLKHDLHL